ncbi:hypothetical protein ABIB83_009100 [Bradyrhizobium sp. I1.8.5]
MNSRLNFRLFIATSGFMKHLILVSIKPAAAQCPLKVLNRANFVTGGSHEALPIQTG